MSWQGHCQCKHTRLPHPRSSSPARSGRCASASWTSFARASTPSASAPRGTLAARPRSPPSWSASPRFASARAAWLCVLRVPALAFAPAIGHGYGNRMTITLHHQAERLGQPVTGVATSKFKPSPWLLAAGASCSCSCAWRTVLCALTGFSDSALLQPHAHPPAPRTHTRLQRRAHAGLSPSEASTQIENWCGVVQEMALSAAGADSGAFLRTAVDYANNECWGTLACRCERRLSGLHRSRDACTT